MRHVNTRRTTRPLLVLIALATCLAGLTTVSLPASAATAGKVPSFGRAIEGYAPYQPQTTCSKTATKGARLLSTWLLTRYRGSSSSGIMRACSSGGRSEHKDGRAFDWHVDARTAKGRSQGGAFLRLARGTDRYGNRAAIARRMGIMYIIWNDRIYSAGNGFSAKAYRHSACAKKPLSKCSPTLRHRDHMHISLGWAGARAVTSFWDGTVSGVSSPPRTKKPPVAKKPVAKKPVAKKPAPKKPAPKPAPKPSVPPVLNQSSHPVVSITVPARSSGVRTSFSLRAGTRYRLVATGYYRFGPGNRVADAACSWHVQDDAAWSRQAEGTAVASRLKLVVSGAASWSAVRASGCDDRTHTYAWDLVPRTTGPVTVAIDDPTRSDNSGALTLRILRAGASTSGYATPVPSPAAEPAAPQDAEPTGGRLYSTETVAVSAADGGRTASWLRAGRAYDVTVSGTWQGADGLLADAECTKTTSGQWRRQRSGDPLHPDQDYYDLYLNGFDLRSAACSADHVYRYRYVAPRDGNATFALWHDEQQDAGSVTVQITPAHRR